MIRGHQWSRARIINGILSLALMALIFGFSANTGEESAGLSGKVTEWLLPRLYPQYLAMSAGKRAGAFQTVHYLLRKLAHFTEFALLGAALRQFLWTFPIKRPGLWAFLSCALFAAADELHQTLVAGRSGRFQDTLIDSAGALSGILLAAAAVALIQYAKLKKSVDLKNINPV